VYEEALGRKSGTVPKAAKHELKQTLPVGERQVSGQRCDVLEESIPAGKDLT
jgi:hypothetical protein